MNIWFTADLHLGHDRIIQYCNRPYKDSTEMGEALLDNFNNVLKKDDILYNLGDIGWSTYDFNSWFDRLNTKNVQFIRGNHDKRKPFEYKRFTWVGDIKYLTLDEYSLTLCHYPMKTWKNKNHGAIHLFGHCHGNCPDYDRSMDVGVDPNKYLPVNWEDVATKFKNTPFYSDGIIL